MVPNAELLKVTLGSDRFGWLKRLNTSARNCSLTNSRIGVDFSTDISAELVRGPMMVLRPALPNVPAGAGAKAAVLNHASQRLGPLLGSPTRFGRSLEVSPLPLGEAPFQKGVIGTPLARV